MAAELQPPRSPIHNAPVGAPALTTENPGPTLGPKRQRRPSVRLGDIGDQPTAHRTLKPWRLNPPQREPNSNKSSKTRPLTNLATSSNGNFNPNDYSSAEATTNVNDINGYNSHRKLKSRRATTSVKRVRTNLRINDGEEEEEEEEEEEDEEAGEERENGGNIHYYDEEDDNAEEGFRDFNPEIDGSLQHSADDAWHAHNRRSIRASRVSHDFGLDDGVRRWLVELGLPRYAPVFEIHEVDDEVLPYLTLEDLKDMGINAVGSRRKLYSAIQKLRKGLS